MLRRTEELEAEDADPDLVVQFGRR
eukprot:COSAG01_NODE_65136_length_274_cov_0.594286_2_plen_24_part_01